MTLDARILVVDDVAANLDVLRRVMEAHGYEVLLAPSGEVALRNAQRARPDLILLDVMMPEMSGYEVCRRLREQVDTRAIPVIFITANDDPDSLVKGFQAGGVDYITKPFRDEEVLMRVRTHLEIARLRLQLEARNRELAESNRRLEEEVALRRLMKGQLGELAAERARDWGLEGLVAESPAMRRAMEGVRQLQESDGCALISGEEGAGKELVARAIHSGSPRCAGPFVVLDGADLPQDVVASMASRSRALSALFGHVAGAFPGADSDREGSFQLADGGTLFLDHVTRVPLPIQASLVRALESGRAQRLGDDTAVPVSVRLLAASVGGADAALARGALHADLHRRVQEGSIVVPPLRERREDLPSLVVHLVGRLCRQLAREPAEVTEQALARLAARSWPGNVRQLQEVLEQALARGGGRRIGVEELEVGPSEFEDIAALTDREVQMLLRKVDQKDLMVALKGASEAVREKVLSNMSTRVRQIIVEEVGLLGPLPQSQVEEVQGRIVERVRRLQEQGQVREGLDAGSGPA